MDTPVLLIDGNNLAHFLYTNLLPGQKMTAEDSRRLIRHLSSYAHSNAGEVEVELCFDRSPGLLPDLPAGLRVFSAAHPNNGDELLLERFAYHCFDHRPCLVITNDEDVLEDVRRSGGTAIKASDFVRRAGAAKPVFREPYDLPPIPAPPDLPHSGLEPGGAPDQPLSHSATFSKGRRAGRRVSPLDGNSTRSTGPLARSEKKGRPARSGSSTNNPLAGDPLPHRPLHGAAPSGSSHADKPLTDSTPLAVDSPAFTSRDSKPFAGSMEPPSPSLRQSGQPPKNSAPAATGPTYRLTIDTWPVREGARFLQDAFCPTHRAQLHELIEAVEPQTARTTDLYELAKLLVQHCGSEANFGRSGALLARVRLALLRAPDQTLTIEQLAEQTGFKLNGLHGRIKEKAGNWIKIDYGDLHA